MTPQQASDPRLLLILERKRVLDAIWVMTLGFQLFALAFPAWLDAEVAELAEMRWSVLVCGLLYVAAADLGYRLADPAAVRRAIYATQCGAVLCLSFLWALSGGMANPVGLVFFAPPLLASGLVGAGRLPWVSAALALAGIWTVADHSRGASAAMGSGSLLAVSAAIAALAASSSRLSELLMRFYQRLRAQSHPAQEALGMYEAVMSAVDVPSLVVYADTLQVAHASDSFYRRVMRRPSEVAGRSLYNVLRVEDPSRLEAALERGQGELPFLALHIGAERIAVNLAFSHAVSAGTRYLHLALHEVTEFQHLSSNFDAVSDAIFLIGNRSELLYANGSAEALLGELYLGKPMGEVLRRHRLVPRTGLPNAGRSGRVEIDGAIYRLEVRSPLRAGAAPESTLFWLLPFAEEEARADRAMRDDLTGLYNRRTFEEELRRYRGRAGDAAPLALALWKLDSLKQIEESLGAEARKSLLVGFASALSEEHRLGDFLCRIDEDRFGLLLVGLSLERAESVVHRMLSALDRRPLDVDRHAHRPEVSVGVTLRVPGESAATLVARAEAALDLAVEGGGGVFCLCASEDTDEF